MKSSFGIILYTSIIIFLMLLTVVTVGTSALDIIIQAVEADPTNKTFVIIAGGSYFLTVQFYLTKAYSLKLLLKVGLIEIYLIGYCRFYFGSWPLI
jgi:hypothetical protein